MAKVHPDCMETSPELIRRFFENKCTPAECEGILDYLSRHPAAMDQFFPPGEWDALRDASPLPENVQANMLNRIKKKIFPAKKRPAPVLSIVARPVAVAAAMLILIIGAALWAQKRQGGIIVASTMSIPLPSSPVRSLWTERVNRTGRPVSIVLPDGSTVRLYSGSSLKYDTAYGIRRRNVYLRGEAFFDVVRNREKPFSVFAGPLQTTVLGTTFIIHESANNTEVKLFTGKVAVRPVQAIKKWKEEIYLSPGQALSYNRLAGAVKLIRPEAAKAKVPEEQESVFNNATLGDVLDKLSLIYHHKIIYDVRDITGMNFTGTISRSDSLVVVLKLIAAMNNLEVQEQGNSFTVSRPGK